MTPRPTIYLPTSNDVHWRSSVKQNRCNDIGNSATRDVALHMLWNVYEDRVIQIDICRYFTSDTMYLNKWALQGTWVFLIKYIGRDNMPTRPDPI